MGVIYAYRLIVVFAANEVKAAPIGVFLNVFDHFVSQMIEDALNIVASLLSFKVLLYKLFIAIAKY